jgi:hypothetical protein
MKLPAGHVTAAALGAASPVRIGGAPSRKLDVDEPDAVGAVAAETSLRGRCGGRAGASPCS